MVFCNIALEAVLLSTKIVTILILIDGFLQSGVPPFLRDSSTRHNPYFNRWFSAMVIPLSNSNTEKESQSLF